MVETTPTRAQELIHVTALCTLLLEALERLDDGVASEELIAALRDTCERAQEELTNIRGTAD
jgi:hypothetical protein